MKTLSNQEVKKILRDCYDVKVFGRAAEITMYGPIVESRPWWAEEDELFIVLKEFVDDLNNLKDVTDLTIRMNSVGGDAYSSITIYNRLRELSKKGMNITCVVDGVAMSGGSLIMCAADKVKVNPSSIVMIHDCWEYVLTAANSSELRKMADEMDVINNSQAEIYARKTGKSKEDIRELMNATTYMTGREAVDDGFADELIEDADEPDIAVSADRKTLFACGHKMRIVAMGAIPENIKVVESIPEDLPTQDTDGNGGDNTPEASGNNEGGIPMTLEELRQSDPEGAEALLAEARASISHEEAVTDAIAAAVADAVAADRQRCQAIDKLRGQVDDATLEAAKYGENPLSAPDVAYQAMMKMSEQGRSFLNQLHADYQESGADSFGAAPATGEEEKPMTAEDRRAAGKAMSQKLSGGKKEE